MRKLLLTSILTYLISLFLMPVTPANAATIQITNNAYNDYYTDFSDGKIAFFADDDNSGAIDIFLYDSVLGNTTRVTNNNYQKTYPYISDGKVIWSGYDGSDYEIFIYEIAIGITTQITNNSVNDYSSQIDSGKIVLMHDEAVNDSELFLYDIAAGTTTQITNNSYNDVNGQISDGKILWESYQNGNKELFIYDIASSVTTQITSNDYNEDTPKLNEGKVTWYRGNEIFLYDLSADITIQIANNHNGDYDYPKLSDGKVVWMGWSDDSSYEEIFLYDIATGTTTQLTNNDYFDGVPQINDGKVVWIGYGYYDNASEIFLYDIATEITTQLTNNSFEDVAPLTADGKVIWGRFDGNDKEIFLWDQAIPDNISPTISPIQDTTINLGGPYSETGSFTDTGSTSWSATVDYGDGSGLEPLTLNGMSFELTHTYTNVGTYTITVSVTDNQGATGTETATVVVEENTPQLTTLDPAKVWLGKGLLNIGVKFDLLAEAYIGDTLVSSGQVNSVTGGAVTFNNATLQTIPFNSFDPVAVPEGSELKLKLSVRTACTGSLLNSGTARIWFNDASANSRFGATIGESTNQYFLRDNFALSTDQGSGPRQNIAIQSGARCSEFKPFGTWTVTP